MSVRRIAVLVTVVAGVALGGSPAHAAVCGEKDPKTGERTLGSLTLGKDASKVGHNFKGDTGTTDLDLYFKVEGCAIPDNARPRVSFLAAAGPGRQLRQDHLGKIEIRQESPSTFDVVIPVRPETFKPGSYAALAAVTAAYLTPSRTPLTVSRSEDNRAVPLLVGAFGALAGLAITLFSKAHDGSGRPLDIRKRPGSFLILLAIALGAGAAAGFAIYADQDVWRLDENWLVTAGAGLTTATTGTVLGLAAIFSGDQPADARA